ncbi:hypothetical protein GCM10022206_24730 [Streptomyces chiangmaiensis]
MVRDAKIIDLAVFNGLFEKFKHSAWRLETRRSYASDEATDAYAQFVESGNVTWDMDTWYCRTIRAQVADGKTVGRVRIVDSPPTTGQRYLMVNAERNTELGEDIRNLWRADAEELQLGDVDFWIFDSRLVAQLNFDADDNLVGVELITEPAEVVRYSMLRDAAMHHAIHCERFAALLPAKEE